MGVVSVRREFLKRGSLWVFSATGVYSSLVIDKEALIAMCDRAGIDVDVDKHAVTVKVNGSEVTGTEGGQVIFKFGSKGQLVGLVVWNEKLSNQGDSV